MQKCSGQKPSKSPCDKWKFIVDLSIGYCEWGHHNKRAHHQSSPKFFCLFVWAFGGCIGPCCFRYRALFRRLLRGQSRGTVKKRHRDTRKSITNSGIRKSLLPLRCSSSSFAVAPFDEWTNGSTQINPSLGFLAFCLTWRFIFFFFNFLFGARFVLFEPRLHVSSRLHCFLDFILLFFFSFRFVFFDSRSLFNSHFGYFFSLFFRYLFVSVCECLFCFWSASSLVCIYLILVPIDVHLRPLLTRVDNDSEWRKNHFFLRCVRIKYLCCSDYKWFSREFLKHATNNVDEHIAPANAHTPHTYI